MKNEVSFFIFLLNWIFLAFEYTLFRHNLHILKNAMEKAKSRSV